MPTYAIGDVQGCYQELQDLLTEIHFNPTVDCLWFAGDLVNRGPHSLEVLRFVKQLPRAVVVLGNHDLHFLIRAQEPPRPHSTLAPLLAAPDCGELVDWLRVKPFLHYDPELGYAMAHAGLFPFWTLEQALGYAEEVQCVLSGESYRDLLKHLYGDTPTVWDEQLRDWDRLRFIVNAFTRMRFCDAQGHLDLTTKGEMGSQPCGYLPWFQLPNRMTGSLKIVFGHWAALEGKTDVPGVFAVDTGCVWGKRLTAMRLEDGQQFSVPARQ